MFRIQFRTSPTDPRGWQDLLAMETPGPRIFHKLDHALDTIRDLYGDKADLRRITTGRDPALRIVEHSPGETPCP